VTGSTPGRRARVRRVFVDTAPLRYDREYRWLWGGLVVSGIGNQITRIALPYQVFVLTGSTLAVAALTVVQLIPILVFALGAGSLADAFDRRRLLILTQTGLLVTSAALAILAWQEAGPATLPLVLVLAFIGAGLGAVDQPARSASVPRLVPRERLPAAIALNQVVNTLTAIVGPAVGGLLIAWVGLAGAYAVDVVTFSATLLALFRISPIPPLAAAQRPGLAAIREGLRFARDRRAILGTFAIDLNAMVFGRPVSLFPVLALEVFRVGPEGFGLLSAAPAAGAFVGAMLSGWVSRVHRIGRGIFWAVAAWGSAIVAFGLVTVSFPLALVCLALAGASDIVSAVLRNTLVQLETPDSLRGRVISIHSLVVSGGPRLGDVRAAVTAALVGPQLAVVSGGVLVLVGAWVLARWLPSLAGYTLDSRPGTPDEGEGEGDAPPT
jgi:MFS family permease